MTWVQDDLGIVIKKVPPDSVERTKQLYRFMVNDNLCVIRYIGEISESVTEVEVWCSNPDILDKLGKSFVSNLQQMVAKSDEKSGN